MSDARNTVKSTDADLKRLNEQIHYLGQYLSTKATYKEFLQANNKKIYRSEHQEEIAKYEEAAQFLKRSSPDGTIPTMKDLRAEKEKLLSTRAVQYESYPRRRTQSYRADPPFGYRNFLYYAFLRQNTIYRYKIIISYYI